MNIDDSLHSENCNQQVKESIICDNEAISYSPFGTCADSKVTCADENLFYSKSSFYNVNVEMKQKITMNMRCHSHRKD